MSVKYAPSKLRVPNGFQNILEGLAREILREQPENIIKFADKYFKGKLNQRAAENFVTEGQDVLKQTDGLENQTDGDPPVLDPVDQEKSPADQEMSPADQEMSPADQETSPADQETSPADQEASKEKEKAAIKIQSLVRGAQARKEVDVLKLASSTSINEKDIDTNERSVEENVETNNEESGNVVIDESADAPASESEATTEVPAGEGESIEDEISLDDPDVLAAATKIQATFRGHKARKGAEKLRNQGSSEEVQSSNVIVDKEVNAADETNNTKDDGNGDDAQTSEEASGDTQVVVDTNLDESTINVEENTETTGEAVTQSLENETTQEGAAVGEDISHVQNTGEQEETGDQISVTES